MDITGLQTLLEVIEQLRKRSIVVKLCEANEKVLGKLDKAGILQALGSEHYHADFSGALGSYVETDTLPG
jgi:SulP family sulfate permease